MPVSNIRPWRDRLDHYFLRNIPRYPVVKHIDPWADNRTCEYCGRREQTVRAPLQVVLCRRHFDRAHAKERVKAEGRVSPLINFHGMYRCNVCGRSEPVMYLVEFRELCFYCLWRTFGQQGSRPLKADGVRVL